jgi:tetratricopeptide (TPR) repeat protein
VVLAVVIAAAYSNSFHGPFVFDDVPAIAENRALLEPTLGSLFGIGQPGGLTTSGRPVLALTLALNLWFGGGDVASFHAVNVGIHLAASLCLFGLVRRTLLMPVLVGRFGDASGVLALVIAGIWGLHPLRTESVTYLVQRAESLAGLFYLLTLYAFARSATAVSAGRWRAIAVVSCLLGVGTKEVVATAPIVLWCYDRAFVSGTFREAWRRNRNLYVWLGGTWIALAWMMGSTDGRGGTAGFGTEVTSWDYAVTQCGALVGYLGLSVWPAKLVFDYGLSMVRNLSEVLPHAVAVLGLLAGTVVALRRSAAVGFLGVWFFALLAPSSSFVPIVTQTVAEHRMYLPLAAIVSLSVLGFYVLVGARSVWLWAGVAAGLTALTLVRNADYGSELNLWRDTAAKVPANARAHNNLGRELFRLGDVRGSIRCYEKALALQPKYPETHYNMGVSLASLGEGAAAIACYQKALLYDPNYPEAHNNLGNALVAVDRAAEAVPHYERALAIKPAFAEAHNNLGNALLRLDRMPEAESQFKRALELRPSYAEANFNLGNLRAAAGDMKAALLSYDRALRSKPRYLDALINSGNAHLALGENAKAIHAYERAIATEPNSVDAHFNLASARMDVEQWAEAIASLETVVQFNPVHAPAHRAIGFAWMKLGHLSKALPYYERYVLLEPTDELGRAELQDLRTRLAVRP